ncbi:phosphoribosyltransferase family protein [Rhodohalobacter sp. 8-1]|uniref:phosphoribosyltransferase family protein n=1 Tax=Rhodohalobacter sp. 8-1 TaxID=3131972 RepID=UPI0030EB4702
MILLDHQRLARIIKRMAFEVVEKSRGKPVDLIGLNDRGFAVAKRMQEFITEGAGSNAKLHQLYINMDEGLGGYERHSDELVMVDDVIYSGKTMFRALTGIPELYSYEFVTVASVVDRGHRKLPVEADIVGLKVPTKENEHVDFQLKNNQPYQVLLTKNN